VVSIRPRLVVIIDRQKEGPNKYFSVLVMGQNIVIAM